MPLICRLLAASHRSVLQQRAVVHSSTSAQDVPEPGGSRAAVSSAGLSWARGHQHVFLQLMVGLKAPVE